jgi:hypothetical protein
MARYEFPLVDVTESVQAINTFNSVWRNRIAIAAPFNKGPEIAQVSANDITSLYGNDNSLGSIAIRQAVLQGATEFVVSRVLPDTSGASGVFSLSPIGNPLKENPTIGVTDNRLVGLTLDFSYISPAKTLNPNLYALAINELNQERYIEPVTNSQSTLAMSEFDGSGALKLVKSMTLDSNFYDLAMRNVDDGTDPIGSLTFDDLSTDIIAPTVGEKIFEVKILKSDPNIAKYVDRDAIQPGMAIAAGAAQGITLAAPGLILSKVYEVDTATWGFLVKANVTAATATNRKIALKIPTGTETYPVIDVFEVFFNSETDSTLPGAEIVGLADIRKPDRSIRERPISYFTLNRHDQSGTATDLVYYSYTVGVGYTRFVTGITLTLGVATDTYVHLISPELTVIFAQTKVMVGETDAGASGFPATLAAFPSNMPIANIFSALLTKLERNSVLAQLGILVTTMTSTPPYSLRIVTTSKGLDSNLVRYKVTPLAGDGSATPTDVEFIDGATDLFSVFQTLNGGISRLTPARRTFYSSSGEPTLYVEALSPGSLGNQIVVSVSPKEDSSFILEIKDLTTTSSTINAPTETFYLDNSSVDLQTGLYSETSSSKLIRAYYLPILNPSSDSDYNLSFLPERIAPADYAGSELDLYPPTSPLLPSVKGKAYLTNLKLQGGLDPLEANLSLSEESYVAAIKRIEPYDVIAICAPGLTAGSLKYEKAISELIAQAENSSTHNGLRIAVLAAPPKLTPARAAILNRTYNSPRLVIVGGYSTFIKNRGSSVGIASPEGFYVGLLSTLDPSISPASSAGNAVVRGVVTVDTQSDLNALSDFTKNNIEMLFVDPISKNFKFLHGRTTANSIEHRWVSILREGDHIRMNIALNLQEYRSSKPTAENKQRLASSVDAILAKERQEGRIENFSPTKLPLSEPGKLIGYLNWQPYYPTDYIQINVIRSAFIKTQFSVSLAST